MCCTKNRPLALFGAFLAIAGGTSAALTASHSREPAPQIAPGPDAGAPDPERRIEGPEKRSDAQPPASDQAAKAAAAKPAR
jgi:hypothetical protein